MVGCAWPRVFLADGGRCRGPLTLKRTQVANSAGEVSIEKSGLTRAFSSASGLVRMLRAWPLFGHNRPKDYEYVGR